MIIMIQSMVKNVELTSVRIIISRSLLPRPGLSLLAGAPYCSSHFPTEFTKYQMLVPNMSCGTKVEM